MAETMKAVRLHQYGGPEVLQVEDAPLPEIADGEVLVRVAAAGVNPIDCVTRAGDFAKIWPENPFPAIVGWDISGVVDAVGNGVTDFKPGDEVYTMARFPDEAGAYAEFAAVPQGDLALKPRSIDHVHAAAVPLVALTVWQALFDAGGLAAGQTVLIHAAAGGVGHIAVQLAKWKGATVIGTASARNEAFLKELGVDQVVDYTTTKVADAVGDVDVQLDSLGAMGRERDWTVMKEGGIIVSIKGSIPNDEAAAHNARAASVRVRPSADQLKQIAELIDAGTVKVIVDAVYPLAEAQEAHEHVEGGHTRGKVVLKALD